MRFDTAQDRIEFVRRRIRQLGFDSFSYSATRTSAHHKTMFVLTSYESQTWLTRYFRERYFELDPRVTLASPTGMPLLWNTAGMRAYLSRSQLRSERLGGLIDMLEATGRKSGIRHGRLGCGCASGIGCGGTDCCQASCSRGREPARDRRKHKERD